jgi:hypothetical protein
VYKVATEEDVCIYPCNLGQQLPQSLFSADQIPTLTIELNVSRRYKFLQGPATSEPSAVRKIITYDISVDQDEIGEEYEANVRLLVPAEHRIDSLGQFSTAAFINATSICHRIRGMFSEPLEAHLELN